jgi:2-polyprenyl-6-methoxyphenol hydroxylase-like FAD-dependent oxidoreductase
MVEIKPRWEVAGAGMYVQGNALRALEDIGVVDDICRAGWAMRDEFTEVADAGGEVLVQARYPRIAGPDRPVMVPMQRRALHDVLAAAVQRCGIRPRMGTSVATLSQQGDAVQVRFTDGSAAEYALVVGADGIRSRVRSLLFPDARPTYTGFANWRVILPRPPEARRPCWFMGRGKSFGVIPLSEDTLYIAGVSKEPADFEPEARAELCRSRFAQFGGLAAQLLSQVRNPEQVVYTAIEEMHLAQPWYRGRVVVLGDAAHASTPFWSQGGAMAVEDTVLLAKLLAANDSVTTALERWMQLRYPRCQFVQEGSGQTGQRMHDDNLTPEARTAYVRTRLQADLDRRYAVLGREIDDETHLLARTPA